MTYSFGDGQPAMDIDGNKIETEKTSAPASVPVPYLNFNLPAEYGISNFASDTIKREKLALIGALYNLEIAFVISGARFKGVEYQLLQSFVTDCLHKIHPIILYWVEHEMREDIVLNLNVSFGVTIQGSTKLVGFQPSDRSLKQLKPYQSGIFRA